MTPTKKSHDINVVSAKKMRNQLQWWSIESTLLKKLYKP